MQTIPAARRVACRAKPKYSGAMDQSILARSWPLDPWCPRRGEKMTFSKVRNFAIVCLVLLVCLQIQWFQVATFDGNSGLDTKTVSSPDGAVTATVGDKDAITLSNRTTGSVHRLMGQRGILCLAFSPDGKTLATGALDSSLCVWNVPSGRMRFLDKPEWLGATWVGFSADSKTLASVVDVRVGFWDVESGKHIATLGPGFRAATFTSGGKFVVLLESDKRVRILEEVYPGVIVIGVLAVAVLLLLRAGGLRRLSRRFTGMDRPKAGRNCKKKS